MLSVSGVNNNSKPLNFGSVYELGKAPRNLAGTFHIFTPPASEVRYIADGAEGELLDSLYSAMTSNELASEEAMAARIKTELINAYAHAKVLVLRKLGQ